MTNNSAEYCTAIHDRASGTFLGLAVGDAVGTTLEFRARDTYPHMTDMIGGGPFKLAPGEWTDDTAMALALADSLVHSFPGDFEHNHFEHDLLRRFVDWWENGTYSCTGRCFDIGLTTRQALMRWQAIQEPHCGSTDPRTAGNGSLMRLAPVALRFWGDRTMLAEVARRQSMTTHAAPEAVDACVAFVDILADAIEGQSKVDVFRPRYENYAGVIGSIVAGNWRNKARFAIRSSGYVAHSLEAALWCTDRASNFQDAVLTAANLGEDADTTAAITGQLAGAIFGASGIPEHWLAKLAWRNRIRDMALALTRLAIE